MTPTSPYRITVLILLASLTWEVVIAESRTGCQKDVVYHSFLDISCMCPSGVYKIGTGSQHKSIYFEISKDEFIKIRLGQHFKPNFNLKDENMIELNLTILSMDEITILNNWLDLNINLYEVDIDTDLKLEINSQRSVNPSYLTVKKIKTGSKTFSNISLELHSTYENQGFIYKIRTYLSKGGNLMIKCETIPIMGGMGYNLGKISPCNIKNVANSAKNNMEEDLISRVNKNNNEIRGEVVDLLNSDGKIILLSLNLNPRGHGAMAQNNRWKYNKYSLSLSYYYINIYVKSCKYYNIHPVISQVSDSRNNNPQFKISRKTLLKTERTKLFLKATYSPKISKKNLEGVCGRVSITENDKENYAKLNKFLTTNFPQGNNGNISFNKIAEGRSLFKLTSSNSNVEETKDFDSNESNIYYERASSNSNRYDIVKDDELASDIEEYSEKSNKEIFDYLWYYNISKSRYDTINSQRIVGGMPSPPGAWPWQVSIRMRGRHGCGGSLINEIWIISAQHCFNREDKINHASINRKKRFGKQSALVKYRRAYCSSSNRSLSRQRKSPTGGLGEKTTLYLIKSKRYDHDIVLIKMDKPVDFNKFVSPICLISNKTTILTYSLCYVTGFGDVRGKGKESVLNELNLAILDFDHCNSKDYMNHRLSSNMLCAGGEVNKDACVADSGGPLACLDEGEKRWDLVGIVSWGIGCGKKDRPGVYTKYVPMT
ncbi:uncharacterized protein LOC135923629 isoform X3 [Gordionus sp. m RMFG-2023]|uniref:uncharacterized protein LOC135923629 isoform X3 n=1 Tax=Gordionus sp. m RMFG-2023 TaxID=3053472 RepID=UPI0031FD317D